MGFEIENGVLKKYTEEPGVTEVVVPDGVTSIGDRAFYRCSNLTSVTIPDSVTSIGDEAFYECTRLTSVTIPDSVTSIGDRAFYWCYSLTAVTIPDSVTSIGDEAFKRCTRLTSVTIPDSVTSIGDSAFRGCTGLADDKGFVIIRNVLYSYHGNDSEVIIPDSVTSIGDKAFYECTRLTSVTIPDSVTSIGGSAFSSCDNLTSVTIPDSVTSIGERAFRGCESLTTVTIPDSVTKIAGGSFWRCSKLKKLPTFGYVVDGSQCNWDKVEPSDVRSMLNDKNYAVKMDHPTKFQFVAQVFLKDRQPEAEAYIKKNISKILPYFINIDDYATVKGLLEHGKFVTKRNIMKFIDYAIEHTQNGGDMQIQVLLMNYKNDNFPDMDPLKSIKF